MGYYGGGHNPKGQYTGNKEERGGMIEETRAAEIEGLGAAPVLVSAAGGEYVPDAPTVQSRNTTL